jgi:hypothetical protein
MMALEPLSRRASADLGAVARELLFRAHRVTPDGLAWLVTDVVASWGISRVRIWLVDQQQRSLVPVAGAETDGIDFGGGAIEVDSSVAGRVFVSSKPLEVRHEEAMTVWLPLVDGVDRIGVLEAIVPRVNDRTRVVLESLASMVAAEVVTRGQYGDVFVRARRRQGMGVAAEVIWQLLPPPTFATDNVTISGALEPAYEVGGDVFDYAFNAPILHGAIFDAVGHGLESSLVATLALNTYRNARRSGARLADAFGRVDRVLGEWFTPATFATGHLIELDTATGELRWVNAGHPAPLLLRSGRVVRALDSKPRPPFGLGDLVAGSVGLAAERLEPGDAVLWYTDGVLEARTPEGVDFGLDRLTEFLERAESTGLAPPEILRRLSHAVVDHHQGILRDDAATVLMRWHPDR